MSENGEDQQSQDGAAISDLSALDEVLLTSSTLRTSADRAQEPLWRTSSRHNGG